MIKIMGLGPGNPQALTIGSMEELKKCNNIYFRTEIHPTVDYIREIGIDFKTYDNFYEESTSFDEVYKSIAENLVETYKKEGDLIYAVPGHPLVAERSVLNLIELCKKEGIPYKIIPAVSFIDAMMDRLQIDPINGLKIIDAFDVKNQILDRRIGTIITQVYNPFIASEVKINLCEYYDDETPIIYCRAIGIENEESIREIPLYELDMQEDIDYLTSIYIPKNLDNKKDIYDLINIVDILRGENGCPWDREQTHKSIKNAIVEEGYEVVEAIENDDDDAIIEELGDVLLQVIFHSAIGKEDGYFNLSDIIEGICNKMVYRHPHVFSDGNAETTEEVLTNWDELKKKEKHFNTLTEELEGIAKSLPALLKASKVQKKVKKVGFDFDNIQEALIKVNEELNEVKDVCNEKNKDKIIEEVGDLLFSCVNISRFLDVDAEEALNKSISKFIKRFRYIEEEAEKLSIDLKNMSIDNMNKLWNKAKTLEK